MDRVLAPCRDARCQPLLLVGRYHCPRTTSSPASRQRAWTYYTQLCNFHDRVDSTAAAMFNVNIVTPCVLPVTPCADANEQSACCRNVTPIQCFSRDCTARRYYYQSWFITTDIYGYSFVCEINPATNQDFGLLYVIDFP